MELSSIEICVGSFVPDGDHKFRLLDAAEAQRFLERIDTDRLRERGIVLDPFDLRPRAQRTRYQIAEAAEWPEGADPFDLAEMIESEEQTIEWAPEDRAAAAKFETNQSRERFLAGLSPVNRIHEIRSPFYVRGVE